MAMLTRHAMGVSTRKENSVGPSDVGSEMKSVIKILKMRLI